MILKIMKNQQINKNFVIKKTKLSALKIIITKKKIDERGYLQKIFCHDELHEILNKRIIKQINKTFTKKNGYVRGLHFQKKPFREMKFVKCVKGEIFDIALDLRKDSKTFLKYHGEFLSEKNQKILVIPEGFAHGFQTMSRNCEILYLHTEIYSKKSEGGLNIYDPILKIKLPQKISGMSKRDYKFDFIRDFKGI